MEFAINVLWAISTRGLSSGSSQNSKMPAKQSVLPNRIRNDPIRKYLEGRNVISVQRVNISEISDINVLSRVIMQITKNHKMSS